MGGGDPQKRKPNSRKPDPLIENDLLPFFPPAGPYSAHSSSNSLSSLDKSPHGESKTMFSHASASSSSELPVNPVPQEVTAPSPSMPAVQEKSSVDLLKDLEKQLAFYVYLEKGLTTAAQKSYYTAGTRMLGNVTGLAPTVGYYDMYDPDAQNNLDLYLQYVQALQATKPGDSGSRSDLLAKIQAIYKNTSWTGNRFPTLMKALLELSMKVLDPKAPNEEAQKFVQAAKELRQPSKAIPSQEAKSEEIAQFIKAGSPSPLSQMIDKKIASYPAAYPADKAKTPNQMDAKLNVLMIKLQENIPQKTAKSAQTPDIHLHEIMFFLHSSLEMLKEMRNVVGAKETHAEFISQANDAQEHLTTYRGRDHAEALPEVLKTSVQLCEKLTGLINQIKDGAHPFDPTLAKTTLQTISAFASLEKTQQRLRGAADAIVASSSKAATQEKKIKN